MSAVGNRDGDVSRSGIPFGLGVVLGLFLVLLGGFVLFALLPIVSTSGSGEFGEHFRAVIVYLAGGAIALFSGLKLSASSKPKAVVTVVVATLVGAIAAGAMVHSALWIRTRPDLWSYLICDSLFWAVDLAIAVVIWRQAFAVVRSKRSSAS